MIPSVLLLLARLEILHVAVDHLLVSHDEVHCLFYVLPDQRVVLLVGLREVLFDRPVESVLVESLELKGVFLQKVEEIRPLFLEGRRELSVLREGDLVELTGCDGVQLSLPSYHSPEHASESSKEEHQSSEEGLVEHQVNHQHDEDDLHEVTRRLCQLSFLVFIELILELLTLLESVLHTGLVLAAGVEFGGEEVFLLRTELGEESLFVEVVHLCDFEHGAMQFKGGYQIQVKAK